MNRFKQLIQAMPLNEQAFITKKSTWNKFIEEPNSVSDMLKNIFNGKEEVQISRKDLFSLNKKNDMEYFIVSTILWGYPRGMRGNYFQSLISQIEILKVALEEANNGVSNWTDHYKKVENIYGLGLSTYSKFLYFLKAQIEGNNALILDNRISHTISNGLFKEFNSMGTVRYDNAVSKYSEYLRIMNDLAMQMQTDSGKLEMFIFEFGLNLKLHEDY